MCYVVWFSVYFSGVLLFKLSLFFWDFFLSVSRTFLVSRSAGHLPTLGYKFSGVSVNAQRKIVGGNIYRDFLSIFLFFFCFSLFVRCVVHIQNTHV